jgi:hypothetical protein
MRKTKTDNRKIWKRRDEKFNSIRPKEIRVHSRPSKSHPPTFHEQYAICPSKRDRAIRVSKPKSVRQVRGSKWYDRRRSPLSCSFRTWSMKTENASGRKEKSRRREVVRVKLGRVEASTNHIVGPSRSTYDDLFELLLVLSQEFRVHIAGTYKLTVSPASARIPEDHLLFR